MSNNFDKYFKMTGNLNMMPNTGGQFGMTPTGYPMMPQSGMQAMPPGVGMMQQASVMPGQMNQVQRIFHSY